MTRPRLSRLRLWDTHEAACLRVLRDALIQLAIEPTGLREVDLNRQLYFCLLAATQRAIKDNDFVLTAPVPEGHNPPAADDAERAAREHKLPDFYWALIDHLEPDPRRAARQFVVECKRLDVSATAGWVFTQQYVSAGILRFVSPEHGYGQDSGSGAMIGYLQRLGLFDALDEVNTCAAGEGLPPLVPLALAVDGVDEFDHSLERSFPESPFRLHHLWVEARPAKCAYTGTEPD